MEEISAGGVRGAVQNARSGPRENPSHAPHRTFFSYSIVGLCGTVAHVSPLEENLNTDQVEIWAPPPPPPCHARRHYAAPYGPYLCEVWCKGFLAHVPEPGPMDSDFHLFRTA
jgi:hypothetical protein